MVKFPLIVVAFFLMYSCKSKRKEISPEEIFQQTTFDSSVTQDIILYDSLKKLLYTNIDTIFNFRNQSHYVFHADINKSVREDADSYQFYYDYGEDTKLSYGTNPDSLKLNDEVSLKNIPQFLYTKIESIFKKLGKDEIKGFTIYSDSTLHIDIKTLYDRNVNVDIGHTLIHDRFYTNNTNLKNLTRDTLLKPNWTYTVYVSDHNP